MHIHRYRRSPAPSHQANEKGSLRNTQKDHSSQNINIILHKLTTNWMKNNKISDIIKQRWQQQTAIIDQNGRRNKTKTISSCNVWHFVTNLMENSSSQLKSELRMVDDGSFLVKGFCMFLNI